MEDCLQKYTLQGTLNEIDDKFAGNDFLRIHQSFLVNMKFIKDVSRYRVLLNKGILLDIPRARYKYVEEKFIAYRGEVYMFVYIQSLLIMMLEILCCKIFFEAFGIKREENNCWKNYSIVIGLTVLCYFIAMIFRDYFIVKQVF